MHEVELSKEAIEFLWKVPKDTKERIIRKIEDASHNPFHYFTRLAGRSDYKLRVGDYRVIADIDSEKIYVRLIGHRKKVYKLSVLSFFY
jgi:mRNA interferase RelE/StbE